MTHQVKRLNRKYHRWGDDVRVMIMSKIPWNHLELLNQLGYNLKLRIPFTYLYSPHS